MPRQTSGGPDIAHEPHHPCKGAGEREQHDHASHRDLAPLHGPMEQRSFKHGAVDQQADDDHRQRGNRLRRR